MRSERSSRRGDLVAEQQAVVAAVGGEQDGGPAARPLVDHRVGGEVDHPRAPRRTASRKAPSVARPPGEHALRPPRRPRRRRRAPAPRPGSGARPKRSTRSSRGVGLGRSGPGEERIAEAEQADSAVPPVRSEPRQRRGAGQVAHRRAARPAALRPGIAPAARRGGSGGRRPGRCAAARPLGAAARRRRGAAARAPPRPAAAAASPWERARWTAATASRTGRRGPEVVEADAAAADRPEEEVGLPQEVLEHGAVPGPRRRAVGGRAGRPAAGPPPGRPAGRGPWRAGRSPGPARPSRARARRRSSSARVVHRGGVDGPLVAEVAGAPRAGRGRQRTRSISSRARSKWARAPAGRRGRGRSVPAPRGPTTSPRPSRSPRPPRGSGGRRPPASSQPPLRSRSRRPR